MARALVTGASGFIGQHLVERLLGRGDEVMCLVRPYLAHSSVAVRLASLGARLQFGDVTEPDTLVEPTERADVVYHLAGRTAVLRHSDWMRVNAGGARNVAAACARRTTPPVLVMVSSLAAARPARDGQPVCEADEPQPVSHYGRSKRAGELAVLEAADRVPTTIVRPPIVLGPGDRASLPMFAAIKRWGIHMVPGRNDARYSVIHAADLVEALILAADRGRRAATDNGAQGVYFVAADETPTYAELGRLIGAAVDRPGVWIVRNARPVVWTVAGISELIGWVRRRPNVLNLDKARDATAGSWICSTAAIRTDLGFSPAAPLDQRLRETAQWYTEHGWI